MNKKALLFLAAGLLSACSASYHVILEPPTGELNRYTSIIVQEVETADYYNRNTPIRDADHYAAWRDQITIASHRISSTALNFLTRFYLPADQASATTLRVKPTLFQFNPGAKLGHSGSPWVGVRVRLENAATGKLLGEFNAYGKSHVGTLDDIYDVCGKAIARFIGDRYLTTVGPRPEPVR